MYAPDPSIVVSAEGTVNPETDLQLSSGGCERERGWRGEVSRAADGGRARALAPVTTDSGA